MKKLISILMVLSSFALISAQSVSQSESQKTSSEVVKLFLAGKYAQALPLAKKAITQTESELGKNNVAVASAWRNLAYIHDRLGKRQEAEEAFDKALAIYEENKSLTQKDEKLYAEMLEYVAAYDVAGGKITNAETRFKKAIAVREKNGGTDAPEIVNALTRLAGIYRLKDEYENAKPLLARALEIKTKNSAALDDVAKDIYENLSCLNSKLKLEEENKILKDRFFPDSAANPISSGVANGKALSSPQPIFPIKARQSLKRETVSVRVLIDEKGDVISVCAVSGSRILQLSAEYAALKAKFQPTVLQGKPVKVSGLITYVFVP